MPYALMSKTCATCGSAFTTRKPQVRFCSKACIRGVQPASKPSRHRVPRDREMLHRLYIVEQESTVTLAERFGVAPRVVNQALRDVGITPRRGRSRADLERRARGVQQTSRPSHHESALLDALRARGFDPVLHLAVDKFNIDLAFPQAQLAVEVDGGNWHATSRKGKQDAAKQAYLIPRGWRTLRFRTAPGWLPDAVASIVSELA